AGHAALNLSWTDLVHKRIRLTQVELRDAVLEIRRTESNRWLIGTIVLGAQEAVEEVEQTEAESGWEFGIDLLLFEDVSIDYRDPIIAREFVVDRASLRDFATWDPDQVTQLAIALSSGEARLEASGGARPFADTFDLDLRVEGKKLDAAGLDALLEQIGVTSVQGMLATDFRIKLVAPPADADMSVTVTGSLELEDWEVVRPTDRFAVSGLVWDGSIDMRIGAEASSIDTDGELSVATGAASLTDPGLALELERFGWRGKLVHTGGGDSSAISGSGDIELADLVTELGVADPGSADGAEATRVRLASLDLSAAQLDLKLIADQIDAAWEGTLQLEDLGLDSKPSRLNLTSLDWDGAVTAGVSEQSQVMVFDGGLDAAGLGFRDSVSQLDASLESLQWEGRAEAQGTDGWRVDAGGEIAARELGAGYQGQQRRFLTVSALRAALADARPGQMVSLGAVDLVEVDLIEREPADDGESSHVVSLAKIDIDGIGIAADALILGEVILEDLQMWLERARDGTLETQALTGDAAQSQGTGESAADRRPGESAGESEDAGMVMSLAGLKTGGETRLVYMDRSVKPAARLELAPLEVEIGTIDAAAPDSDTPIRFTAANGRYGKIVFEGQMRPLSTETFVNGEGTIKDLNMIRLDGYARRAIGYAIKSGTLSADVRVDLQNQRLDSAADLTIRKLEIDPLKPEEQDEFSTELGVPLETALGLLEDDEATIRLNVPLQGELSDLSVGVGDAVRLVMKKGLMAGMRTAATTYFAPLWPALAATKLFAAASKLRFRPVTFAPGATALEPEQDAYLQQMAPLMQKRPKVSLTLCGRAVAADRAVLYPDAGGELDDKQRAAMADLSRSRHEAVKDRLIEAGIDSARLVTCTPEASPADEGLPRVDFGV
ncbi:MAG: DUF748 domain-containing protein, partial [Gammaproteobacteria bacterium]